MPPAPDNPGLDDSDIAEIIERGLLDDDELTKIAAEIRQWEEDDVLELLRSLLMHSGPLGIDEERRKQASLRPEIRDASAREYWRRLDEYYLLAPHAGKRRIGEHDVNIPETIPYPWEGITWILDLLRTSPDSALRVMSAYIDSHFYVLPDGRLSALGDAAHLIRTYYIGLPEHTQDRIDLIAGRTPIEFERLVAQLYGRMGYEVTLTPVVGDDGIDLFAAGSEPGRHEKLCIQCKTSRNTIPIKDVRELGYAAHKHQATKGVFVTTSRFSPAARKEELLNTHLELLDGKQLVLLLNQHLGHEWPLNLERLVDPSSEPH